MGSYQLEVCMMEESFFMLSQITVRHLTDFQFNHILRDA